MNCNTGFCGNNWIWIILLILRFCNCGGNQTMTCCERNYDRGCGC